MPAIHRSIQEILKNKNLLMFYFLEKRLLLLRIYVYIKFVVSYNKMLATLSYIFNPF